ncbi:MAG: LysR family transcriptional regulator [Gammaproteobacteria bacterium]|nr:LysR family transcriptional regulator [Gammaproteobacteria bacterium]
MLYIIILHTMDLTLMRSLLAVCDAGAITEAADRLGVTQPALSRRIQQLEEHFGVALLARGPKGVSLTAAGDQVAAEARVLVARYDHLRSEIAAHLRLEGGSVRIGGGATAVAFVLPSAIAGFQTDHAAVRFQVKEAGSREIEGDVVSGRLELGLVTMPVQLRDLDVHPLLEDRIVPICRHNHPLATNRSIDVRQLAAQTLVGFEAGSAIRQIIDTALRDAGVQMRVAMELRSIPAIVRMVAATGNLAFISHMGIENESDVRALHIKGLQIKRRLALITRRDAALSPAASAFADRLRKLSRT